MIFGMVHVKLSILSKPNSLLTLEISLPQTGSGSLSFVILTVMSIVPAKCVRMPDTVFTLV